jgi:hypothetical protein
MKFETNEDAIRYAISKIIEQGRPSMDEGSDACLYRGPDGTRCVVGWLIPDGEYEGGKMEGKNVEDRRIQQALSEVLPDPTDVRLLSAQRAHDEASSALDWDVSFVEEFRRALAIRNLDMFWPAGT